MEGKQPVMQRDVNSKKGYKQGVLCFSWVLEMCVLSILSCNDAYGYEISQLATLDVSESTIYPILRRLQSNGYLKAYQQLHTSRLRKMYGITPKGTERLANLKDTWNKSIDTIDRLLYHGCEAKSD